MHWTVLPEERSRLVAEWSSSSAIQYFAQFVRENGERQRFLEKRRATGDEFASDGGIDSPAVWRMISGNHHRLC